MTLEEVQKAFPIGSLVINETHYGEKDNTGVVTRHVRYVEMTNYGQYYVCWGKDRSSWPVFLRVVKPLSSLEQSIADYIAVEKRELGLNA